MQAAAQVRQEGTAEDTGAGHSVLPPVEDAAPNTYGEVTGGHTCLESHRLWRALVPHVHRIWVCKNAAMQHSRKDCMVALLPSLVSCSCPGKHACHYHMCIDHQ